MLETEDVPHPANYKSIVHFWDKSLIGSAKLNKDYLIKHFHRADKNYSCICRKHKISTPKLLENQVVDWYHNALCHPRKTHADKNYNNEYNFFRVVSHPTFCTLQMYNTLIFITHKHVIIIYCDIRVLRCGNANMCIMSSFLIKQLSCCLISLGLTPAYAKKIH